MVASVAVLSDIHGVPPALDRVLVEPAVLAAELLVVTGDHTWGPQPAEVLDRLTGLECSVLLIRGNADRELRSMAQGIDIGLGDDPVSVWGATQLCADHRALLEAMPEQATLDVDGFDPVRFCHATPRDDEEVVLVDSRIERWLEVFADLPETVGAMVCGHTHLPYLRQVDRRLVVISGSVGLPYGRRSAHWAVLADGAVTLGRTLIDPTELAAVIVAGSTMPSIEQWVAEMITDPASDLDALRTFGPRDGR